MANRKVGIIGYGEGGKQIEYLIKEDQQEEIEFFYFDDVLQGLGTKNAFSFASFDDNEFNDLEFYIGLGYRHLQVKRELCEQLQKNGFHFPALIHKTAYVHPTATIGNGAVIYPMANIGFNVVLSDGVVINNSSVISHNTFVGAATFISPAVSLMGFVNVGVECFLGAGTIIANGLKVGNRVTSGIGTMITKDVGDDALIIGNPSRLIEHLSIK